MTSSTGSFGEAKHRRNKSSPCKGGRHEGNRGKGDCSGTIRANHGLTIKCSCSCHARAGYNPACPLEDPGKEGVNQPDLSAQPEDLAHRAYEKP